MGGPMPRLVYLVDWLPPDYGAIGQYALQESEARARAGDEVTLVGLTSAASSREERCVGQGRLRVLRLHSPPVERADFKRRAAWTLATDLRLVWRARRALVEADEILFTASPPFLEHLLVPISAVLRGKLVFRIADLHPECLMQELAVVPPWLERFHGLTQLWRRRADVVEVLGEDQRRKLLAQGVDPRRIVLRRSESPVAITRETTPLARPEAAAGKALLLYSGAVGHAHDIDTFVEGYAQHHARGSGRVLFWLNATGARAPVFVAELERRALPFHRSEGVPLEQLASLLVTPDAHLITQRDAYVGLVVPSKVYGCLASKRDLLFVGSAESDVHLLASERLGEPAYRRVEVGDAAGVARALEALADRAGIAAGAR